MRTILSRALGGLALLAASALAAWQVRSFLVADSCLDAGGSFNYSASVCDFTANHPAQTSASITLLGVSLALVVFGISCFMRRRAHAV
jgi:hypothetical protein